jgi:heme-degrading monooxygenase HmoA
VYLKLPARVWWEANVRGNDVFTRAALINVKPGCEVELTRTLEQEVVPLSRRERGFRGLLAFVGPDGAEALSLSLWDQEENAREESGLDALAR